MFSIICMNLVKDSQVKNKNWVESNKRALKFHEELMKQSKDCSRAICPINLKDCNRNKYYGPKKCNKCINCTGELLYDVWFLNFQIQGDIKTLQDNHESLELKKNCFYYLNQYRKELKEILDKLYF